MARRRYVSTTVSTDKIVAKLANDHGDFAALLYTWMIPHAADDGGITADPEELRLMIVPGFKKKSSDTISKAVAGMLEIGLIDFDEATNRLFFPAQAFYKHQSYISAANRRKDDITQEPRYQTPQFAAEQRVSPQNAASPPPPPSFSPSPSPSVVVGVNARDEISEIVSDFARYGTANALTVAYVEDAVEEYGVEWVKRAVTVGGKGKASGGQPPWNYIEKTLQRWKAEGGPDDDKPRKQLQAVGRIPAVAEYDLPRSKYDIEDDASGVGV